MRQNLKLNHVNWIKITDPSSEDIRDIAAEFSIHPLVLRELVLPTLRPKVDSYDDHLYMVLHVPVFNPHDRKTYSREIDFVLLANTLITVSFEEVHPLEEFWSIAKKNSDNPHVDEETGHFLYHLVRHLLAFALRQLDHIQENIDTLEDMIFYNESVDEIAHDMHIARRDIIDFRRTFHPQESTLESLVDKGSELYGKKMMPFFSGLVSEYLRISDILESHRETINELYETNVSIVSGKINRTMKVFTVLAFITFVPNLVTNIFGMTIEHIPLDNDPRAFWIIMGGTFFIVLGMYLYFRSKKIL